MTAKKPSIFKRFWRWFSTPSRIAIGVVISLTVAGTIAFVVGFNATMAHTNTLEFCSDCHMNDVVPEYKLSPHFTNRSGVRATCADCHVPHEFIPKMVRKVQAAQEVYAYITGQVDTNAKFNAARLEMAEREWARMKANNSAACRACHQFDAMDFTLQKSVAQRMHELAQKENKTCIDCHKGIAHQLPNMHGVPSGFVKP